MIPFQPIRRKTAGPNRQYVFGRNAFMVAAIGMAALMVGMIGCSILLAGGQIGPSANPVWGVVVPWPVFPIPVWLVVALGCIPPIASLILVPKARPEHFMQLNYLLGLTVILFGLVPVALSRLFPATNGPIFDDNHPDLRIANHWWAAVPQVITVVLLIFGMIRVNIQERREAKAHDAAAVAK